MNNLTKIERMNFQEAVLSLKNGDKIKLPEWTGYWFKENDKILVFTGAGEILDTPYLDDNKNRLDWDYTDGSRNFGGAVQALVGGKMITRKGWNGKDLFVFMQVPSIISLDIVSKMQSLPQAVKNEFIRRRSQELEYVEKTSHLLKDRLAITQYQNIAYNNQLALVYPDNTITGWSPSASDALAVDWLVL